MELRILKPRKALNKAFLKVKPNRTEIERFKTNLIQLLNRMNDAESEEFHKNLVIDFLKKTWYDPNHYINTKGRNDLVIHNTDKASGTVGVIVEAKKPGNKPEMLTQDRVNVKAFQELVLYYLRERITQKNIEIKYLIATNINEWFIFDATLFDRLFAQNKNLVKQFIDFEAGRLADIRTDFFYKQIAEPFINEVKHEIEFTHFDIREYDQPLRNDDRKDDSKLIALFKLLSPEHLLKLPFANDSNSLDKRFYGELLHIIGLTETKEGSKKLIERNRAGERNSGSLLENAIIQLDSLDKISRLANPGHFGSNMQERLFNVGLELVITWINRILFLKLLEAQLITYHKGDRSFEFLSSDKIKDYDDLNSLFFQVLARKQDERNEGVSSLFAKVPYLNSSLFEPSDIEHSTLFISNLRDDNTIPVFSATVLKDDKGKKRTGSLNPLEYLFAFLNAYDFASEGSEEIQEDNKTLINASVLGLIFEKINGYKDGSFFTPGFITMYMCRETIRKAVVQKFNETKGWNCTDIHSLYDKIEDRTEANSIINSLKICDPAVGSGHFLVSALNEMIAIKSDLKVLQDREGRRLKEYSAEVVNDELIVTDEDGKLFEYNPANSSTGSLQRTESQRIQETLFHEKQAIIENCLFGVDINPNSVKICRLRLWIELLKNAYYKNASELETLPNIDINIKCGNSLISRFALDADLKQALKKSADKWTIDSYRLAVDTYRNAENKEQKRAMERLINEIKTNFRSEISSNDPIVKRLRLLNGELFTLTNQGQLFEFSDKEKANWNVKVEKLTAEISKLEAEIEEIKGNKIYENAFEWRFEFPEVLNDNGDFVGFDVVIGNPPYGVKALVNEKEYFKDNYQAIIGKYDSYGFFIEKGVNILKKFGQFGFIVPHTWLTVLEAQKIREFILSNCQIVEINQLPSKVFEDATVETTNLFLQKNKTNENYLVRVLRFELNSIITQIENSVSEIKIPIDVWKASGVFNLKLDDSNSQIIKKLQSNSFRLNDICELSVGIQAYDKYAAQKKEDIENRIYHSDTKKDDTYVKEINGKEVNRYRISWSGESWVSYGIWLAHPRQKKFFDRERILVREITSKGKYSILASFLNEYVINYKSVLNIISRDLHEYPFDLKYILGLLNSAMFSWYFNINSNKIVTDTFPRISIYDLKDFPIKIMNQEKQNEIVSLVNRIMELKIQDVNCNTAIFESQIDQLVYQLYDLTPEEIEIIESGVK
jgi:hypothetical protein